MILLIKTQKRKTKSKKQVVPSLSTHVFINVKSKQRIGSNRPLLVQEKSNIAPGSESFQEIRVTVITLLTMDLWANVKWETEATRLHIFSLAFFRKFYSNWCDSDRSWDSIIHMRHFVEHLRCVVELGSKPMAHVAAACCQGLLGKLIINGPDRDALKHAHSGIHVEISRKGRISLQKNFDFTNWSLGLGHFPFPPLQFFVVQQYLKVEIWTLQQYFNWEIRTSDLLIESTCQLSYTHFNETTYQLLLSYAHFSILSHYII